MGVVWKVAVMESSLNAWSRVYVSDGISKDVNTSGLDILCNFCGWTPGLDLYTISN